MRDPAICKARAAAVIAFVSIPESSPRTISMAEHETLTKPANQLGMQVIATIEDSETDERVPANKAKLEAALASMMDAMLICDADGRFIEFNDSFVTFNKFLNKSTCPRNWAAYIETVDVLSADGESLPLKERAVSRALRGETGSNVEYIFHRKDTGETWVGSCSFAPIRNKNGIVGGAVVTGRDITRLKQVEMYRHLSGQVLEILNKSAGFQDLIRRALDAVKQTTGCAAVGMRLQSGIDFPYFAQNGFSDDFLMSENSLLGRNSNVDICREPDGAAMLECICGLVISGNIEPSTAFTPGGSFWTNDSSRLPDLLTGYFPRLHLRKRCIHDKYASIAIVPIRAMKNIVGVLQLNDYRKNRFSIDTIQAMENIVSHIGEAVMQHRTLEAMKKSEEIHATILKTAMDGFIVADMQGRILEVNDAYCRMTGYSKAELLTMSISDMEAIESFADTTTRILNIMARGEERFETRHRCKDRSLLDVEVCVQYKPLDGGRMVSFIRDNSQHKMDEERIHKLSQLLIAAQENERHLISCELHDSIAQNLSALKIGFNSLPFDPSISISELREKQAWFARLLSQTINDVRNLAYDLRLPGLEEMGLVKALEIYCADASEKGKTNVNFHSAGLSKFQMGTNMEIHIYRLIQEGWSNIRKHADADHADILLLGSYPNIILRIEDNGKGFDMKKQEFSSAGSKRMGIRSMQERVNMLQGQMTIQSQSMNGTKIMIKLPLPPNPDNATKNNSESKACLLGE